MSLLAAYTFNEKAAYDYAGNKNNANLNNIIFIAGQNYGYAARFQGAGTNYNINFIPNNFTGFTALSIFTSLNIISLPASNAIIAIQGSNWHVKLNSSGNIIFNIGGDTLTSAGVLSTGWNTIGCVWDGANTYIYLNGVQDANVDAVASATINNTHIYIGSASGADITTVLNADMDSIEFRSIAMSAGDMASLHNSPGGTLAAEAPHNFLIGDIIGDPTFTNFGVVTYIVDKDNFYFYPTSDIGTEYARIGNIMTSLRGYYMQFLPDFDTNGNGQFNSKLPISGFSDLADSTIWTLDYRGLIQTSRFTMPTTWYSQYQKRFSEAGSLTTLYTNQLKTNSFIANGSYLTFNYQIQPANNANAKTVYVKFQNQVLISISVPINNNDIIYITGQLKMTDLKGELAIFNGSYYSASITATNFTGNLSGINFASDNLLILQALGIAYSDLVALNGDGIIYPQTSF